jgi:hypothetical protein
MNGTGASFANIAKQLFFKFFAMMPLDSRHGLGLDHSRR